MRCEVGVAWPMNIFSPSPVLQPLALWSGWPSQCGDPGASGSRQRE